MLNFKIQYVMKSLSILVVLILSVFMASAQKKTFYDFSVKTIDGKDFNLSSLKGKKVLVVNTASKCGLTPQYKELEEVYAQYKNKNFIIIGFPANNFKSQEPGSDAEIKEFCTKNYSVSFTMMSKISVVGDSIHPLYKWLTTKSENGLMDAPVMWNFQKFMIDEKGNLIDMVPPKEKPNCEKIINWISAK